MRSLLAFALNTETKARHTYLSRSQGVEADLPDLAAWLGASTVDTDRIELFPLEDLGDMALSDYIATAFDVDTVALQDNAQRLNKLEGAVLLAYADAIKGDIHPGPQATLIADLPIVQADHSSDVLGKTSTKPVLTSSDAAPSTSQGSDKPLGLVIGVSIVLLLIFCVWWFLT